MLTSGVVVEGSDCVGNIVVEATMLFDDVGNGDCALVVLETIKETEVSGADRAVVENEDDKRLLIGNDIAAFV
jgi:hypothetical protein